MKLPWHTRTRIAGVRKLAGWLRVPVEIRIDEMPESKIADVDEYIETCEKLFGPIFDAAELPRFRKWVHPFLKDPETMDNPFNLYNHYLETVALFFGISHYSDDTDVREKMDRLWEKYQASGLKLTWWEKDEKDREAFSNQNF